MIFTLKEFLGTMDIKCHESKTQYWSKPEGTYQMKTISEALCHFITVDLDHLTKKTSMVIYGENIKLKVKFDINSLFRKLSGFSRLSKKILSKKVLKRSTD